MKNEDKLLEQFYNDKFNYPFGRFTPYSELTDGEKAELRCSFMFSKYKLAKAQDDFVDTLKAEQPTKNIIEAVKKFEDQLNRIYLKMLSVEDFISKYWGRW